MVKNMLKVERCSVMLLGEDAEYLCLGASIGIPREEWEQIKVKVGEGISGTVAKTKTPLLVRDIGSPKEPHTGKKERYTTNSFISLPLMVRDTILGVINVTNKLNRGAFSDEDLDLLRSVANLVALSIHNAQISTAVPLMQKQLMDVLDIIGVGLISLSGENAIVSLNETAIELLELHCDEDGHGEEGESTETTLKGQNIISFIDASVRKGFEITLQEAGTKRSRKSLHIRSYPPDAPKERPLEVVALPVGDNCSRTDGIFLVIEDLSLSKEVSDLKKIDEIKSNFLSVVSHELRTPLTSIKGALHLLNTTQPPEVPESVTNLITIITNNVERLVRLVNTILDITEIEGGELFLHKKETDIILLLERAYRRIRSEIVQKGITFEFHPDPSMRTITLDAERFEEAIVHLLENAQKFTSQGGIITLSTQKHNNTMSIILRDTGSGIPPEHQKRIFDRFYQVDDPLTRRVGGSGLGLYLARILVEQHGGSIVLSKEYQEGAEFVITLPLQ